MLEWFKEKLEKNRAKSESALREVYCIQLRILNDRYNQTTNPDTKVHEILNARECPDWVKLYEVEQRLIDKMPAEQLPAEGTRRLLESKALGVRSVAELEKKFSEADTEPKQRAVLWTIVDDLHWRYVKRGLDRASRKRAAKLFYWVGTLTLVPFLIVLLAFLRDDPANWIGNIHILLALYFGLIGAFLSRIIAFQSSLDTIDFDLIDRDFSGWSLTIRLLTGVMGALVMYLLIRSGLLGGSIFPSKNFAEGLWQSVQADVSKYALPGIDFAKLVVWSIVAGFSERLIPDQLARLEASAKDKPTGAKT